MHLRNMVWCTSTLDDSAHAAAELAIIFLSRFGAKNETDIARSLELF